MKIKEEGQETTAQQCTYNQVLQGDLLVLKSASFHCTSLRQNCNGRCRAQLDGISSRWKSLWTSETKRCVPFIQGKRRIGRQECFSATSPPLSPQPTCATSLDGLQFASPPAPPYVSRKRGNKEIPCYALQCFPEKRPHPCTWDEAE